MAISLPRDALTAWGIISHKAFFDNERRFGFMRLLLADIVAIFGK